MIASSRKHPSVWFGVLSVVVALSTGCSDRDVTAPGKGTAPPSGHPSFNVVPGGGSWATEASMPTARLAPAGGVIDGQLYVVGGIPVGGYSVTANQAYDPAANSWTDRAPALSARALAGSGVINGKLYVAGGWNNGDSNSPSGQLEIYDPAANAWSVGSPMSSARGGVVAGVINDKLYVAGGDAGGADVSTLEIFNPATNVWTLGAPMPTARYAAAGGVINGVLYVVGGIRNGALLTTLEAYNAATNTWTTKAPIPTAQRYFASSGVIDGILYIFGGQGASGILNTVSAYDPGSDSWTIVAPMQMARQAAAVGAVGATLYVAGGQTPSAIVGTNEAFAPPPTLLADPTTIPQVDAGIDHTCALKSDATVVCWGRNDHGETTVPSGLTTVAQVSAGGYHTCALKIDKTAACWGDNTYGQSSVPSGLTSVVQISAGVHHNCALKADGTVACWGWDLFGQSSVPGGLSSVTQVSAGGYHTCALRANGTMLCWGRNSEGETTVPAGLSSIVQVVAGNTHTCARKTDLTVVCWGGNGAGYDFGQSTVPAGLTSVIQVSARNGSNHTCALRSNATVVCWGWNRDGETTVPAGLGPVAQVSAGSNDTCALVTDGTVACWGGDPYGQIEVPSGLNLINTVQTPPGTNVSVTPVDQTTNAPSPLSLTFATVTGGGTTTVTSHTVGGGGGGPPAPGGFRLGSPPTYYDIQTTATFSGSITICVNYTGVSYGNENNLKLLHYASGAWTDVTTSLDTVNNRICGTTSSLSPFLVAQANAPPTARLTGPSSSLEGSVVSFDASASSDPDGDIATYTWDFGDGSAPVTTTSSVAQHTYADNRATPYTISVTVTDSFGAGSTATMTLSVANVAPMLSAVATNTNPIEVQIAASASVQFNDPGTLDTHTATIAWGDGQSTAGSVSETNGAGTVSGTHAYTQAGVYTVSVTVTDKDGGQQTATSSSYVVAYNPDGGFVTGGGWITSPAGAYTANPSATGKANFGFVAKYEHGATTPSGNTQFALREAGFSFASTSYDWLVVSGAKAQYKGFGTVNGQGSYRFMLTVIDGDVSGGGGTDRLRLRVWNDDTGGIVYDNQMNAPDDATPTTALGGGSIVIHKP